MNDLNKYLFQIIYKNKNQNIIISWGDSLKQFFFKISNNLNILTIKKIFLSDERIVSHKSKDSNKLKILQIFRYNKKFFNSRIISIPTNFQKMSDETLLNFMEKKLENNKKIDTAILSVAKDGHIASLLSVKYKVKKYSSNFAIIKSEEEDFHRITFRLKYLANLRQVILVIINKKKSHLLKEILEDKKSPLNMPFIKLIKKSKNNVLILTNKQCYKFT